jgi:hypothetical protein
MIEENTVFILGAGASKPYGYPTGRQLKDEIIKKFKVYYTRLVNFDSSIPNDKRAYYDSSIESFIENLEGSNPETSIDLFLSRNKQFADIGKLAIALILSRSEITGLFRSSGYIPEEDWCSFLFDKTSKDSPEPEGYGHFAKNRVNFITFNYDRSFDHLIYDRLAHDFTEIQAVPDPKPYLIPFSIIHVYGVLATLPWQQSGGHPYRKVKGPIDSSVTKNSVYDYALLESMAKNIRIIQERTDNEELDRAKDLIKEADRIFFLGFGYAPENMEAIGFPESMKAKHLIYGTAKDYMEREIYDVKAFLESAFFMPDIRPQKVYIEDLDCRTLLRKYL